MSAILTTFGIDWRLLLINMLNFGLLVLGLWYFLYGPVIKMLEDRRLKLTKGVEDADKAGIALRDIEQARSAKLAQAGQQADEVLARARAAAAAKERELRDAAELSAESLIQEAQAQAHEIKSQAIAESREEVAKLIVLGIEKGLAK